MKICLVHHEYPEETSMGGIATYQKLLAIELKKLGNKVTVIAASLNDDKDYYEDGIHIIRYNKCIQYDTIFDMRNYRKRIANKLHELFLNNELDIIESPEMGAECLEYIKMYHDVPVVCKLHTSFEIWAEFNETTLPKSVHNQLVNWEREYVKKSDKVISCTNLLYQMMKDRNQISRTDIKVIGNPTNIDNFYPISNVKKDNSILYLGGLEQRKGLLILAQAIPIVLEKYPNITFKFIGRDTKSNDKNISMIQYIKSIVPNKYWNNLLFLGFIENNKLNELCNKSIIGVIPSCFDNLPYVAFEEILSGLPIIASDNTGVKEIIENNKSGILFENGNYIDLAEKIIYLYENKNIRDNIIKNGIKKIKNEFSPNYIALQNLNIYVDAINRFYIKKHVKNVEKISQFCNGIANNVYKVDISTNKSNMSKVFKFYLQNKSEKFENVIIYNNKYDKFNIIKGKLINNSIFITKYYDGFHKEKYNKNDYINIFRFMNYFSGFHISKKTLLEKIKDFSSLHNTKYITESLFLKSFWNDNKSYILKLLKNNLVQAHGDLSKTNIIFNNNAVIFIDFDEMCLAPKYYDLAVLSVKHCINNNGHINKKISENIIINYQDFIGENINYNEYILTMLLYLYKVLIEKFYWSSSDLIDLEDEYQKKDYYKKYYIAFKEIYLKYRKYN